MGPDAAPQVTGTADLPYLAQALARAGVREFDAVELASEALSDGRTGASVTRLTARLADGERRRFVLKVVPASSWRTSLGLDSSEARLWLASATRALPAGLRCPTLDVARHAGSGAWWILMDDVSAGIAPRGYDEARAHLLLGRVARLHARYWERDRELAALPLASSAASGNALAALGPYVARGELAEPWLESLAQDFRISRTYLPLLLDAMPARDADFYLALCRDHADLARALTRHPSTLLHGDLRRANIAYAGDEVVLFDWEFAARGPAARDLQWYWFLQFWAYPPGERAPADRRGGLEVYLATLEHELGRAVDRAAFDASCELAWLSVFCQIGFCLADPLGDAAPAADAVARARRVIAEAIELARRLRERHVR